MYLFGFVYTCRIDEILVLRSQPNFGEDIRTSRMLQTLRNIALTVEMKNVVVGCRLVICIRWPVHMNASRVSRTVLAALTILHPCFSSFPASPAPRKSVTAKMKCAPLTAVFSPSRSSMSACNNFAPASASFFAFSLSLLRVTANTLYLPVSFRSSDATEPPCIGQC